MARHYLINGVKVPFTAEQETWRDQQEIQAAKDLAAENIKVTENVTEQKFIQIFQNNLINCFVM